MMRMDEPAFSRILDGIYDAAIAFERWPVALDRLGQAFGCTCVALIDRNSHTMQARTTAVGIDLPGQRAFAEVWSRHDVLRQRTLVFRPGAIDTDRDILPKSDLLRSDFYNGFMRPYDMHAALRMTLTVEGRFRKIISMLRPRTFGEYDTDEVAACRRLMPHLQRAARVTREIEASQLMLTAFSDMLEESARGFLLLDRSARVLFANRQARVMAQSVDGFLLRRERLEAIEPDEDAALQRLLAGATGRPARTEAARGDLMRLSRKSGKADYVLLAAPLARATALTQHGPVAFVLISDPDTPTLQTDAGISRLFGFSAAETRVAERLLCGDSPEEAAAQLGIKTSTARWHLASLYRKTGTGRQAQLVRRLLSPPMM
jgi:DNA-binding CsgD family transcriptional regulator/PAS domain-containing protein